MDSQRILVAAGAGAAAAALLWFASRRPRHSHGKRDAPVLCFGDSLTEGYFGIWKHPIFGPTNPNDPALEMTRLRLHPYSIRLGARLAVDASDVGFGYASALKRAMCRAYSGWTAQDLKPRLLAALCEGPWRLAVVLAGDNDIILQGAPPGVVFDRVVALISACDAARLPVLVLLHPDADLAHHGMVPPDAADTRRAAIVDLAERLRERCVAESRPFVDLRSVIPMGQTAVEQQSNATFWDDCLHPSPEGSDKIGDAVFEAMMQHNL